MKNFFLKLLYDILVGVGVVSLALVSSVFVLEYVNNYFDRRMCGEIRSVVMINKEYAITKFIEAECNSVGIHVGKANVIKVNEK